MLHMLARQLRTKTEQAGALRLDQPKLCFSLNQETGLLGRYRLHQHRNRLSVELMLLSNTGGGHQQLYGGGGGEKSQAGLHDKSVL